MRTPTVISTTRAWPSVGPLLTGILGCLIALALGAAAATEYGSLVLGAVAGLIFCGVGVAVYARDPVRALIWLWLFVVFNAPLSILAGYYSSAGQAIRQADEVLVLLFVGLTIWRTMRSSVRLPPLRFILPGIGVAFFGLLGAVLHHVPLIVTLTGIWLGLKLWTMVGVTLLLPWKMEDLRRVYAILTGVGLLVAALGFADYLTHGGASQALHIGIPHGAAIPHETRGFRTEAVDAIFPHPGEYSLFMSLLFALTFARFGVKRSRSDLALACVFAGSVLLSLRLKGFLSVAVVVIIVALVQSLASNRSSITILLVGALLVVGVYSVEGNVIAKQIATYASSETTARARLYTTGERIAQENFPLGVGFGRFASYPSRLFYSPVYYQYDLASIYGLERPRTSTPTANFIDDTSWPTVMGETGYGGFLIYLAGIVLLILALVGRLRAAAPVLKWVPLAALCVVAVILSDSLGAAALFDWLPTTTFAIILGPAMLVTQAVAGRLHKETPIEPGA